VLPDTLPPDVNSAADQTFQRALAALSAQNAGEAERLFRALLQVAPKHVGGLNLLAVLLTQRGQYEEAERHIRLALKVSAQSDATHYNHGIILKALQRPAEALESFTRALAINPNAAETWNNRGTVLNELQRPREAIADFDRAIAINPRYADAFFNKARSFAALNAVTESLGAYQRAAALNPRLIEAWVGCGNLLTGLGRGEEALAAYEHALALAPKRADAWLGRGTALFGLGKYDDALAAYDQALALNPNLAEAWQGRGIVFARGKRTADASAAYDKALQLNPALAEAWLGRANLLNDLKQYDGARAAYEEALKLNPALGEAWLGLGNLAVADGRPAEALAAYDRALERTGALAEAWLGRGNALTELERFGEAFAAYDQALARLPDLAEAWLGRGNVYCRLKQYGEALAAYDRALAQKPGLAEAWLGRANAFAESRQFDKALLPYDKALAIDPDLKFAAGDRLYVKLLLADWEHLETETSELVAAVQAGKRASNPFQFITLSASPAAQRKCAETYVAVRCPPSAQPLWRGERYAHERIRLAYVSPDFRQHPVAYLTAGMFEAHDRGRFETTSVSIGPKADDDEMHARLRGAFEHFLDAGTLSDQEIAEQLRAHEIDIAVDLGGFTDAARPRIFARRPAPVQATYLGYPGTTGAPYFDYIIADRTILPPEHDGFFTERVAALPFSYQANDAGRRIAERVPTRAELGLPEAGFVFCCFNNSYKLGAATFAIWMRLLKASDGSVLWLSDLNASAKENLRREAQRHGVEPARLVFAPRVADMADHLARHRQADLFLDTLPFNAHTTASDALWSGLPLVTCLGSTLAGRVAASLLGAVGLPELVTASLAEYEALAQKIAAEPEFCAALKAKLARNRAASPLFDTVRFTRSIEAAYATMWRRSQSGEPPVAFAVEP